MSPLRRDDPERLGRYELTGRLGTGGMGVVYLAEDPDGTFVAVKLLHAALAGDAEFRARFRGEVERARQVPSFCTAEVLDADVDHDPPYLVVEYVDGPSLLEVVEERGPLGAAALQSLAVGVATALSGIHGAGVVHRDLKPENVLLAPGSPKVIDFGIARTLESHSRHTQADQMVGTVAYMAPERFSSEPGEPATPAADVFAWGCVIAYAATGRTPFEGDSPGATAARILTQPPRLDGVPQPLRNVVALALAKDPADRPAARELLDMVLDGRPVPAVAAVPAPGSARRRARAVLAVALIAAGVAVTGLVVTAGREDPAPAPPNAAAVTTFAQPSPSSSARRRPANRKPSAPAAAVARPSSAVPSRSPASKRPPTPGAAANPSGRNLALGSRVTASSMEGPPWGPSNAVDGDPQSRWSSGFSDPQWLSVDLGRRRQVTEIKVRWEHAYAISYRVEISTDGSTWKRVYNTTVGEGGDVTVPAGAPARYVRVYGTSRVSQYGYSLYELEVR